MAIRETSDSGKPVMATDPDGAQSVAFRAIAREILSRNPQLRS
jgi:ATP-binding protein involved in chromosome partitioning